MANTKISTMVKNEYGYCEYEFVKDSHGDYVHIYNLYVHPEFRRKGKAKNLLQIAISSIKESGYNGKIQIVAQPSDDSISKEALISFYESMGLDVYDYYGEEID